jgi:hypothetical protein
LPAESLRGTRAPRVYGHDRQPTMRSKAAREMPCEGTCKCRPPPRSPGSSERPEPSLATLMGPPGSPWSLSAPINHVRSIEQSAAWPSRSSAVSQEGRQARGPPFLQVVRTGLALRSDERLPSRYRRAGSGSTGSRTRPSQGQQHDAAPRRSFHGPCVCPRTSSPASSAHDVRANSA